MNKYTPGNLFVCNRAPLGHRLHGMYATFVEWEKSPFGNEAPDDDDFNGSRFPVMRFENGETISSMKAFRYTFVKNQLCHCNSLL